MNIILNLTLKSSCSRGMRCGDSVWYQPTTILGYHSYESMSTTYFYSKVSSAKTDHKTSDVRQSACAHAPKPESHHFPWSEVRHALQAAPWGLTVPRGILGLACTRYAVHRRGRRAIRVLHEVGKGASGRRYLAKGPEPRSYYVRSTSLRTAACVTVVACSAYRLALPSADSAACVVYVRLASVKDVSGALARSGASVPRESTTTPRQLSRRTSVCSSTSGRRVVCVGVTLLAALVLGLGRDARATVRSTGPPIHQPPSSLFPHA